MTEEETELEIDLDSEEVGDLTYTSAGERFTKFHTRRLFFEKTTTENLDPVVTKYTLRNKDREVNGVVYKSLKKLYIEMEDIGEYDFANKYLSGWEHWEKLSSLDWFQSYLVSWRRELQVKMKARALKAISDEAALEGKNAFSANKWLLANKWDYRNGDSESKQKNTYVSKKEVKKAANELDNSTRAVEKIDQDLKIIEGPNTGGKWN